MYCTLSLLAYIIDKLFSEFSFIKFYKHPVMFMGDYIKWFEDKFYQDNIIRGIILNLSLLFIVSLCVFIFDYFIDNIFIQALVASSGLASKMLYDSVKDISINPDNIKYLVSRDTHNISNQDKYKAGIETYAENLSDAVIAPLLYLLFFGLYGLFIYKAVNTLDSMVGYRTKQYEMFGKFSAIFDDILNYIPARITAVIITLLFWNKKAILNLWKFGKLHKSPNAGYPISAISLCLNISLGGNTSYFGKITKKPYFGDVKNVINKEELLRSIKLHHRFDLLVIFLLLVCHI